MPKYTNDSKKINKLFKKCPDHNENIYAVEAYNNKIHASIEIIKFKKNGKLYIYQKRKKIDQCELAFQKYSFGGFNFILEEVKINNKIKKICFQCQNALIIYTLKLKKKQLYL